MKSLLSLRPTSTGQFALPAPPGPVALPPGQVPVSEPVVNPFASVPGQPPYVRPENLRDISDTGQFALPAPPGPVALPPGQVPVSEPVVNPFASVPGQNPYVRPNNLRDISDTGQFALPAPPGQVPVPPGPVPVTEPATNPSAPYVRPDNLRDISDTGQFAIAGRPMRDVSDSDQFLAIGASAASPAQPPSVPVAPTGVRPPPAGVRPPPTGVNPSAAAPVFDDDDSKRNEPPTPGQEQEPTQPTQPAAAPPPVWHPNGVSYQDFTAWINQIKSNPEYQAFANNPNTWNINQNSPASVQFHTLYTLTRFQIAVTYTEYMSNYPYTQDPIWRRNTEQTMAKQWAAIGKFDQMMKRARVAEANQRDIVDRMQRAENQSRLRIEQADSSMADAAGPNGDPMLVSDAAEMARQVRNQNNLLKAANAKAENDNQILMALQREASKVAWEAFQQERQRLANQHAVYLANAKRRENIRVQPRMEYDGPAIPAQGQLFLGSSGQPAPAQAPPTGVNVGGLNLGVTRVNRNTSNWRADTAEPPQSAPSGPSATSLQDAASAQEHASIASNLRMIGPAPSGMSGDFGSFDKLAPSKTLPFDAAAEDEKADQVQFDTGLGTTP